MNNRMERKTGGRPFLRAAAVSAGIGVLLAQIVWNRQLVLLLGGSVDAATAVLSAFMMGLGLGGRWFGKRAQAHPRPGRLLRKLLLLCAALSALPFLGSHMASGIYPLLYTLHLPKLPMRLLLSLLLVFPAAFAAGGVVPVMARLAEGRGGDRETARLYGLNALGSALGGFLAGFVLLEAVGSHWTLAAGMALLALPAVLRTGRAGASAVPPPSDSPPAFLLVVYGASGLIALGYESVWARQLSYVLGNSTYAFSLLGVMMLVGIGLGSLLGQLLSRRLGRPLVGLGVVEVGLGVTSVVPLSALGHFNRLVFSLPGGSWPLLVVSRLVVCGLYLLPSALLMGATFPLIVKAAARRGHLGEDVGALSLANCLGAAAGPLLVSLVLFRHLGVTVSSAVLACGSVLLGLVLFLRAAAGRAALLVPAALTLVVGLVWVSPPPGSRPPEGMELAFFEEDRTATVSVFTRAWDGHRSLRINGVEEVPVDQPSLEAFYLLGHLPWGYNAGAENAVVVALGGGITCGALLTHPLDTLACADLCPSLASALPIFSELNRRPDLDPRFEFVVDDGRNFLLGSRKSWDIVICDATHPGSVDSWVLYTREFYSTVLDRLNSGGVAAQWVPLHQLPVEEMLRILTTWSGVFPHSSLHLAGGRHLVLVGSAQPLQLDTEAVFADPAAAEQLEGVGYSRLHPEQLLPVLSREDMAGLPLATGLQPNTDLKAYCQFIQEKVSGSAQSTIAPNVASVLSLGREPPSRLQSAQILYWRGDLPAAAEMLRVPRNPLEARWLAVVLTTAADQLRQEGKYEECLRMVARAIEADSGWYLPVALQRLVGRGAE